MSKNIIKCPKCKRDITEAVGTEDNFKNFCPGCKDHITTIVFPAKHNDLSLSKADKDLITSDNIFCFNHEKKKAVVVCTTCGKYLCKTCDISIGSEHYCTQCLENEGQSNKGVSLVQSRPLYDSRILYLAFYPIFTFYFSVLTAPAAFILSIVFFKKKNGILPRSKLRHILSMVISLLTISFWALVIVLIIYADEF